MPVRTAAKGGRADRAAAVVAALVLMIAGVSACGQGAGAGHAGPPGAAGAAGAAGPGTGSARGVLTASVVLDSGGHAWQPSTAGTVLVSTDAGRSWVTVRLPGHPANGHSVVVSGQTIAAVTVTARGGLDYQRSTNGGASWRTLTVPTPTPTDQASIALSGDGKQVAVMASIPGNTGEGDVPELAVGPAAGPLRAVSAPVSGYIAWAGSTLVVTGGPLQSRLYTTRDEGVMWTARPVNGPVAPRFNVPPSVSSFGVPMPGPGTAVTVPVTEHGGSAVGGASGQGNSAAGRASGQSGTAFVQLYRSVGGTVYTPGARVALTGVTGPGVTALASPAGPGRYVIASPGSTRLYLVNGDTVTAINPAGLAGTIDSLTFSDARNGLAETTQQSCSNKNDCRSTARLYRTSNGGQTWIPIGT